jgi:hypothetical protein
MRGIAYTIVRRENKIDGSRPVLTFQEPITCYKTYECGDGENHPESDRDIVVKPKALIQVCCPP